APTANNTVYVLGSDRNLWREYGSMSSRDWVDGNVSAFFPVDVNYTIYVRGLDGNLWRERGSMKSRDWVDGNVTSFFPLDSTNVYVRGSDGNLWLEKGSMSSRSWVDGSVFATAAGLTSAVHCTPSQSLDTCLNAVPTNGTLALDPGTYTRSTTL